MGDREAKKFRGNGMGFGVVELGETGDEKVKVSAVPILYAEVVND